VEYLVLDEADRLFGADFLSQTDEIIAQSANPHRSLVLCSATLLPKIEQMAKTVMQNTVKITVGVKYATDPTRVQPS